MRRASIFIPGVALICLGLAQTATELPQSESNVTTELSDTATLIDARHITADSTFVSEHTEIYDSLAFEQGDSTLFAGGGNQIPDDTTRTGFTKIDRTERELNNSVTFSAKDSLLLFGNNNAYLYGNGDVEYNQFRIKSATIRMELDSNTVYASGYTDSTGVLKDTPVFKDGSTEYESESMKYNFKTQRGFITDIITEQGDGYLTGGASKKMEDGSFFVEDGFYTTCDDHEHPHFGFKLTRAKVRPQKDVVTGPGYMVLAGVPLPLALPFGYFPFSKDYSSGIIFPSFGEDYNKGFYLRDGGYYFAFSDYVDLALRGEIYTKGSWGINAHSSYVKRYRFSGSFDISFLTSILGDKGAPDYQKMNNFQVVWSHTQDAKANPNMNFSASVNFATSGYSRNDVNSYYNSNFTENTKSSTVNFTYRFPGTKWSASATANITQRSSDSTLAVSFPNLNVTMSQTQPFKRKKSTGGERWYEKIRLSYSGQFQNSLTSSQDDFFKKSIIKDWRNGFKHNVPISATFSMLKYINVSPSINLNDVMYTSKIKRQWDTQASRELQDTVYGFYNLFDFNASISLDTKLYGFYRPLKFMGDKLQMVRHVLTPTISFSYAPDFGSPFWGMYDYYTYTDQAGTNRRVDYSYFSHGIYGVKGRGKQGSLNVSLANNLEMKVKSDADTTGVKKISLIENLTLSQSYNFAADSMRWSPLQASIMLRLTRDFNLNLNSTWDPYTYSMTPSGSPIQVNIPRWKAGKGWVRLSSASTSFSYTFNNDTFRRKEDKQNPEEDNFGDDFEDDEAGLEDDTGLEGFATEKKREEKKKRNKAPDTSADGYFKWKFPWSLTVNYSVSYGYGDFNPDKMEYKGRFNQNLSLSGNVRPTDNWNFSFSASYDFTAHKIAYMNCSISRDLHCFTMTASFVPVGPYKSYNFHIAVKSSLLKDLKYDKRSSTTNGIQWY